jgi:hypothetical protein
MIAAFLLSVAQGAIAESDLLDVFIYSVVFSTLLGGVFQRLEVRFATASPNQVFAFALALGVLSACAWQGFLVLLYGGWLMALGIPIFVCWLAAGLSAGMTMGWFYSRAINHLMTASSVSLVLLLGAVLETRVSPIVLTVVLRGQAGSPASHEFFRSIIGSPGPGATEHSLLDAIEQASVIQSSERREVIEIQLRRGVSHGATNDLVARIRSYPPVESVTESPPSVTPPLTHRDSG